MRLARIALVGVTMALLPVATPFIGANRSGMEHIQAQVSLWHLRDGAAVVEVGAEISRCLVANPEGVLRALSAYSEDFQAWVQDLQHHSFTDFKSSDSVDQELSKAYHEELKVLMRTALERVTDDPALVAMAGQVTKQLEHVELKFID